MRQSAADAIAEISWFLESGELVGTAEKFTDEAYDFIQTRRQQKRLQALSRKTKKYSWF